MQSDRHPSFGFWGGTNNGSFRRRTVFPAQKLLSRQFQFWREEVLPPPALYDFSFTALARHSPLLLTTIRHHTVINTQFSS